MSYTAVETARIVGISYRQLDYWDRTDLISPSQEAHGSGTRRAYSYTELVELRIVKAMLDAGTTLTAVRKVMQALRSHPSLDIPSTTLVITEDSVRLCSQDELVEIVSTERTMLNVLPLAGIVESLDLALHEHSLVDVAQR